MQVVLVMFRADGERRSFSITRDVTVIGRREDCDLRIPLGDVSRKHCRLIRQGEELHIEDLGSSNGTYLNGIRAQDQVVSAGDTLNIGPVVFCVQIDGLPLDEDLAPLQPMAAEPEGSIAAEGVTIDDDVPSGGSMAAGGSIGGSAAGDDVFQPAVEGSVVGSAAPFHEEEPAADELPEPPQEAAAPVASTLDDSGALPLEELPATPSAETQAPHEVLGEPIAEGADDDFLVEDSAHGEASVAEEGDEVEAFDLTEEDEVVDLSDEPTPTDDKHPQGR